VIAANCRQYARHLNPAIDADMGDGLLDVVFMPAATSAGVVTWGLRCFLRRQLQAHGVAFARGAHVEISSEDDAPWQCDGEAGGWLGRERPLEIKVAPASLKVLLPC
jgi:diacylglycerol kinase family enzyme